MNRENLVFSLVGRGDMSIGRPGVWETGVGLEMTLKEKNNVIAPSRFFFGPVQEVMTEPVTTKLPSADF